MNINPSILSPTMKHSLCNNFYSSFITNKSDLTTMIMMSNKRRRTNLTTAIATTTTTTTGQKDNLSMTIEHVPILNHNQTTTNTTNILSISNITENQLNLYKKEYYREHQRRKRTTLQYRCAHAARERQRVAEFNKIFKKLYNLLPINHLTNRRLSKLQILKLCTSYIYYLTCLLHNNNCNCITLKV
uniref:BHLH domain-containing protein n=1 Tax=Schistosoma mansoni TaxID=6183 RepID=A0A5K4F944_SCHMA